jgi:signal transduction histidine kinase
VLGWFAAGRVLRPLRSMTATARTISAGNLHERLALSGPEGEFEALGDTLDDLLSRLGASFGLQVPLADPNAGAHTLRATGEELLELQAEHERMLEALLTLASSERGLERREPVDLTAAVEATLRRLRFAIETKALRVDAWLDEPAATTGDPALIERLIANLIENGVEHNVPHGSLEVRTEAQASQQAVLTVSSTGAEIPADEVERLFEPFQRLNGGRGGSDGHHGLGLSIVRTIAAAHGAHLTASARPGGGLTVTVRFVPPV